MSEKYNPTDINRVFARNLKALRKSSKVTQMELGERLGVKKSCISNYEQGISMPDASKLIEIAKIFGIENIGELLGYSLPENCLREDSKVKRSVPIVDHVEFMVNPVKKEHIIDEFTLPSVTLKTGEFFGIIIEDNSMDRSNIRRGDIAVIRRQAIVATGDIALVACKGMPALLRRVYTVDKNTISLQPDSNDISFLPVNLSADMEGVEYEILGRLTYKITNL